MSGYQLINKVFFLPPGVSFFKIRYFYIHLLAIKGWTKSISFIEICSNGTKDQTTLAAGLIVQDWTVHFIFSPYESERTLLFSPSSHFVLFCDRLDIRQRSTDPNLLPCQDAALESSGWPSLKLWVEHMPSGGRKEGKTCRFEPAHRTISSFARNPHGSPGRLWTGATSLLSSFYALVQTSLCTPPDSPTTTL